MIIKTVVTSKTQRSQREVTRWCH